LQHTKKSFDANIKCDINQNDCKMIACIGYSASYS